MPSCTTKVDDCSGLAYSEILAFEREETVTGFWIWAQRF